MIEILVYNSLVYKRIKPKKLTGKEYLKNIGRRNVNVLQLWQYAFSNLNSNVLRSAFAEFLVEVALKKITDIGVRNPWGDYDVVTANGSKIEVKCSSYIQDWYQEKLSKPVFSGLKSTELFWNSAVSGKKKPLKIKRYKADIYIFALLAHKDPNTLDILDMNQWEFYILTKDEVKKITNDKGSITLTKIKNNKIPAVHFKKLKDTILVIENTKI